MITTYCDFCGRTVPATSTVFTECYCKTCLGLVINACQEAIDNIDLYESFSKELETE